MTRRDFGGLAFQAAVAAPPAPLVIPVHQVIDSRMKPQPGQIGYFWSRIWPEAVRDFASCGIHLKNDVVEGEVRRSAGDRPVFVGLDRRAVNLILTAQLPMRWDRGRALCGVTTRYDGYHICMIALAYAHAHQIPLLSVNTCVHELLHALLQDIFEKHGAVWSDASRELRIDWYATRLWLFRDGGDLRMAAHAYLNRLHAEFSP